MRAPPAPFEVELVREVVVRPGSRRRADPEGQTPLAAPDQVIAMTAIGRALGFPARIDDRALEAALASTIADLPFLAGRLGGLRGGRLGSLVIRHTGDGVPLRVAAAPDVELSCMGGAWLGAGQQGTVSRPPTPWYLEPLEVGPRLLRGDEPLMRVRLTRLADGDVLGFSFAHVLFDGTRWPRFAAHLGARYREAATGAPADLAALLAPADRGLLSVQHLAPLLLGKDAPPFQPSTPRIRGSLLGYLRLAWLLAGNARQARRLHVLHLPAEGLAALKELAGAGDPAAAGISTGDAVQAAAALLAHAALGLPPLPVGPKCMCIVAQLPTPPGFFGNGGRLLPVRLPAGSARPAEGDWAGALRALAGAIRQAVAAFRSDPEAQLGALADSEALAAVPAWAMLSWLAADRLPRITVTTNYVPAQEALDLGLGQAPAYDQEVTWPVARGMVNIRPAQPPSPPGGLALRLCLSAREADRLRGPRGRALVAALPHARWVAGGW